MLELLLFLAGMQIIIMLLATGYRYIDLWYRIGEYWPGITARLITLIVLDAAVFYFLDSPYLNAFFWGQISYLIFHVAIFWVVRIGFWLLETARR
ncbi:MAG: hypothetical protein HOC70_14360 [Gammaproteobacteria bacterium]|jgi:hypothetical protein|nr:hypothetical protein [Gammaproteobacteria bacterium]MBT4494421.1 hypothetical protein [Gammaproteobacteria bacterium]MBT7370089.1 hypothetical protein [Gammaproteobacteria bacterium]